MYRIVLVRVSVEALICLLYSCASSLRRGGLPTVPLSEVAPPSLGAPATYYGNFSRSQGRDHGNGNVPLTRAILSQYPRVPNVFRTATLGTFSGTCSNGVDLPFLPGSSGVCVCPRRVRCGVHSNRKSFLSSFPWSSFHRLFPAMRIRATSPRYDFSAVSAVT